MANPKAVPAAWKDDYGVDGLSISHVLNQSFPWEQKVFLGFFIQKFDILALIPLMG